MTSLYGLTGTLLDLTDAAPDDDEAQRALVEWFAHATGEHADKVDDMLCLSREMRGRAALRAEEAKRIASLSKRDLAKADFIEGLILESMRMLNRKRVHTSRFDVTACDNGTRPVVVNDENALPDVYRVAKVNVSIDKASIAAALERGEQVPGARLGERGQHLRVR